MKQLHLHDYFLVTPSKDLMTAEIDCKQAYDGIELSEESIKQFLQERNIVHGIQEEVIQSIINNLPPSEFPLIIAKGTKSSDGENGKIKYESNFSSEVEKTEDWNFRDVMRIPTVKQGEKIATVTLPTNGRDGKNIFGKPIKSRPGKPVNVRAGKNVIYREEDRTFYAVAEGQLSIAQNKITIHTVYEVNETLSMKTGNINFIGSVVIHGDVPTGYEVRAEGDIKIYGIVEGATIIAKGSVFVSEGLAGIKKGMIQAGENIHIGYINQGIAKAGNSIYVHHSIIHSECTAKEKLFCQNGNIIGGSISAGRLVEAKDIGNRLSTKTIISLGIDRTSTIQETELLEEKQSLEKTLSQLNVIGKKLEAEKNKSAKTRIMLLRQRNSKLKVIEKLEAIDNKLEEINGVLGNEQDAELIVGNYLYPNTMIEFGKYKQNIQDIRRHTRARLVQNEIVFMQNI